VANAQVLQCLCGSRLGKSNQESIIAKEITTPA
jgi:hypothetical protein